jgi:hypothetical protein
MSTSHIKKGAINSLPTWDQSLREWLQMTEDDDIEIQLLIGDHWKLDRHLRTCTIKTSLQELKTYRKKYQVYDGIRLSNSNAAENDPQKYFTLHLKSWSQVSATSDMDA